MNGYEDIYEIVFMKIGSGNCLVWVPLIGTHKSVKEAVYMLSEHHMRYLS